MKAQYEIEINATRQQVWDAFDNLDNLKRWQPTLQEYIHQSGERGHPGSVAELVYNEKGRVIRMTETVSERRKPDFLAGAYDNDWAKTIIVNHFEELDGGRTRWISYCNYRFKGFMRIMALFVAGSIKRRVNDDMNRFKLMVETDLASA